MLSSKRIGQLALGWPMAVMCVLASMIGAVAVPAAAQFQSGDVIVGVTRGAGIPPETEPWIKVYTAAGAFKRISSNGATTRMYQGTAQIALDPDGQSFWTADGLDSVSKIDLATGNTVTRSATFGGFPIVDSLTVVGEPRAALAPESIPALSEWLLVVLAAAVGAIAVFRLNR